MFTRCLALFPLLCAPLSGCLPPLMANTLQPSANPQVDASYTGQLVQARGAYQRSKTAANAITFAVTVESVYRSGAVGRGQADGPALITEACAYLDEAAKAYPPQAAKILAQKGPLYIAANDKKTALLKLEESMSVTPTVYAAQYLLPLYGEQNALSDVIATCKKTRAISILDDEKYLLLDRCVANTKARTAETGLAWAPEGDIAYYRKQRAARDARAAKRAAENRQKIAETHASNDSARSKPPSDGPSASGPAVPSPVSVSLRSSCPRTVKVFFGKVPKFGSGTTSSVSSNSISSHLMLAGDMIWLIDGSENGLSSVTISDSTREVEIKSDCTSIH